MGGGEENFVRNAHGYFIPYKDRLNFPAKRLRSPFSSLATFGLLACKPSNRYHRRTYNRTGVVMQIALSPSEQQAK